MGRMGRIRCGVANGEFEDALQAGDLDIWAWRPFHYARPSCRTLTPDPDHTCMGGIAGGDDLKHIYKTRLS